MRIGIDLGGRHIGIALIENNIIKEKIEIELEKKENIVLYIMNILDYYISKFKEDNNIELIGIASPGNPNNSDFCITNIVNLGIERLDLNNIVEKYKIPIK